MKRVSPRRLALHRAGPQRPPRRIVPRHRVPQPGDPHRARVRGHADLRLGQIDISQGGLHDLVVMDDFSYGEPNAIE
jgi:hypothetical protein